MMQTLMLNRVAQGAGDWFLARNFCESLRPPLAGDNLIRHGIVLSTELWVLSTESGLMSPFHPLITCQSVLSTRDWPDSGLTRNTRCHCYRCSVPGLAGFTRLTLCGARSLITGCQLRLGIAARKRLAILPRAKANRKSAPGKIIISRSCDAPAVGTIH